jgi:putative membrane protein
MRMQSILTLTAALMLPSVSVFAAADYNDAEIAGIVVAANEVDIEAGRVAQTKSQNEEVKAYAHRMVGEHTDVNDSAKKLVAKLGVKPETTTVSTALRTEGAANTAKFTALSGAAFDRSYIKEEIELHEKVIDVVDKKLIPNAKNEELKALLVKVRPSLVSHLEHARKIQGMLGDK